MISQPNLIANSSTISILVSQSLLLSPRTHLSTAVDGLAEPDVLLVLGASVPVLAGNALRVCVDAGFSCVKVAEDLDGIHDASLVGVDPVVSYEGVIETSGTDKLM